MDSPGLVELSEFVVTCNTNSICFPRTNNNRVITCTPECVYIYLVTEGGNRPRPLLFPQLLDGHPSRQSSQEV